MFFGQQNLTPHFLRKWDSFGQAAGQFHYPNAVAVAGDMVFVADTHNHRMQSFRSDGSSVKQWGSRGSADGQFHGPRGVAVLARSQDRFLARSQDRGHPTRDCMFIADTLNHRVQVFGLDGTFIHKFGTRGRGDGQFECPVGVAVLARSQDRILARSQDRGHPTQDLVYITDQFNDRVQVFGSDGTFVRKWGSKGSANGQFNAPCGVAVLARSQDRGLARSQDLCHPHTDLVFVADSGNDRIQSFRGDGTPVNTWGSRGSANGQLQFPCGVAVLARSQDRGHPTQDLVYVADCHNHRIQVFNFDGSFVRKWGSFGQGDGQFHYPCEVAVLARSQDRCHPTRDCVFVADTGNQRMQVFDTDGTFIRKWGAPGSGDGQFLNISGVAVHPSQDLVFISDYQGHRIQAFRGNGVFLFKWGSHGSADGQLRLPKHLALHPTRDLLFIADSGNHRVQVFDLHGSFVCKWGSEDALSSPLGVAVHPQQDVVYVTSAQFVQAFTLFTRNKNSKKSTVRTQC